MAGGVGYSWFEVELVSYHVPVAEAVPAGSVALLPVELLELEMPVAPDGLVLAIAPSQNLSVLPGNSQNLSVDIPNDIYLSVDVEDSENLQIED